MKPVYISGEVNLAVNDVKSVANASSLLANPFARGMWIDRINFAIGESYGGLIQVELRLGNTPLTDGFVPTDLVTEPQEFSFSAGSILIPWVLKHPIFVPKGEFLFPRFYHSGIGGSDEVAFRITYVGRSLEDGEEEPAPGASYLPYVASWVATPRAGGSNYTDKSSESNFRNPFSNPLEVSCLRGRIGINTTFATDAAAFEGTLVRAVNQDAAVVIKDNTEFFTLFGDGFWRSHLVLPPNGFLVMSLTENYSALSALTTYRPRFSMIGYRRGR